METGWHLGDLTDEFPGMDILEFVSGGCKQYGLKMRNSGSNELDLFEHILKIRGFCLNYENCKLLNYEIFKRSVLQFARGIQPEAITLNFPLSIRPNVRSGKVTSVDMQKYYQPVVTKGIVGKDFFVYDFGKR